MYSKPTDTHQYLDFRSCHPRHVKEAIPYGQALRLRRICSSDNIFDERIKELKRNLYKRGFKKDKASFQCKKARVKDRKVLLAQNKESIDNSDVVPLVLNFYPAFSRVHEIVESLWPMMQASDDTRQIFKDKKPLVSFGRPRNLADNLVRSKIKRLGIKEKGMRKCHKPRCQICNYVEEAEKFVYDKHKYWINYSFDCDSEGVIYVLRCISCLKIYVGSTITSFRKRFNNHKSLLRKYEQGGRKMLQNICMHIF